MEEKQMKEMRTDRYKLKDIFPKKAKHWSQRLHKKADEIEFIRKGIPLDPNEIIIEEGERAAVRWVTTPRLDRDNEILIPHGVMLDDFEESGKPVLWAHDYHGLPIGRDQWIKVKPQGILAKTEYANHAFAEDVFQCVKGKFLNSNSVGFIPVETITPSEAKPFKEWQETLEKVYGVSKEESGKAKNIYTKWILLEHSDVPIASNVGSLNIAVAKGELPLQTDRIKKDLEIRIEKANKMIEVKIEDEKKPDEVTITKPETTDNYHRIPVEDAGDHEGHRIRTITISAEQGIKAIYCGTCKKVITYLFDVDKWTMAEAQAWVRENKDFKLPEEEEKKEFECECIKCGYKLTSEEHCKNIKCLECGGEMRRVERPGPEKEEPETEQGKLSEEEIIGKGAIPYKDLGYLPEDTAWDGPGETAGAEVDDLKVICAWFDSENPDIKGSYKLPHHKADGHKAVWNGVKAAMGATLGARGGVDIPSGDKKSVYNHLSKHYAHWDKEVPEFKDYSDDELKELFPEDKPEEKKEEKKDLSDKLKGVIKLGDIDEWIKAFESLKDEIAELKEGRVLSRKNRQTIKDAIAALQDVLKADEAGSLEEEEKGIISSPGKDDVSIEIEKGKADGLEQKIMEHLGSIDIKKKIDEAIDLKIKKIKGVVE
jgi:hypothetical protein